MRLSSWVCFAVVVLCLHAAGQQKSCTVIPADATAAPAEQAYREGNYAKSYDLYKVAYAANPSDQFLEGEVRAAIEADRPEDADALVKSHPSGSAWYLLARSRVELNHGHMTDAQRDAVAALKSDICNADAHYFTARLLRLNSMYASARKQINVAHQLDRSNPRITAAWLALQPMQERAATYKKIADDKTTPEAERQQASQYAQYLEDKISGKGHSCHLVSATQKMTTDMTPIMEDGQTIRAWGLTVRVNGKPNIVEIDTGASGLLINRGAAERAGLKLIDHAEAVGVAGKERLGLAYADSIKVGDYEFADCIVQVTAEDSVGGHGSGPQGILGMDVFQNSLVTLDFPLRKLTLGPLPGPKTEAATEADTQGDGDAAVLQDRYDGPEVKDYMQVYREGNMLMVPMLLNGKEELMTIDSGANDTHFNLRVVPEFTKASRDTSYYVTGVGGKNDHVYTTGEVKMQMPNGMGQFQNGALATDMRGFGDIQTAGLLGASFLYNNVVDIDYRDGLVRMTYDRNHGHNALRPVQ